MEKKQNKPGSWQRVDFVEVTCTSRGGCHNSCGV